MPLLAARHLTKSYGATPLLADTELHLRRGERVGLVGRNGSGKSTLLKALAGHEPLDAGELSWRSGTHVAWLPQDPDLGAARTLLDVALAGVAQRPHPVEPHEAQTMAEQALKGLGVPDPLLTVALASGGTRRRAALAAALLQQPDLLLLDEPTNHLDAATAAWLQEELRGLPGALIVITHDRYFLNQVVDRIVELRGAKLRSYDGTFEDYLETRLDEDALADRQDQNRRNAIRNELEWLRRSPAARTTKPRARIDRAHALLADVRPTERALQLPEFLGERLGKSVLETRKLSVGWPGRPLVENLDLHLLRGERLGIVGPNGAGKTTLLKTLLGEVAPLAGQVHLGSTTRIVSIDQHRSGLDSHATVMEAATPAGSDVVVYGGQNIHVASWLGMFLFRSADLRQPVATLSGGQRFRLLLARRLQEPMNLLLLDEPTNDLDFETLDVLEEALLQYPGCVLAVSHDRAFLDRVCTGILHVTGDGTATRHAGTYTEFVAREKARHLATRAAAAPGKAAATLTERATTRPPKLTFAEAKKLAGIEAEIEVAEAALAAAEAQLQASDVMADHVRLADAVRLHGTLAGQRDALYAQWERLEGKRAAWASTSRPVRP